jgi:hypothetical protein
MKTENMTTPDFITLSIPTSSNSSCTSSIGIVPIKLRIDSALIQQVDTLIKSKLPSPSRNHWIASAIAEKLERDLKS